MDLVDVDKLILGLILSVTINLILYFQKHIKNSREFVKNILIFFIVFYLFSLLFSKI